MVDDIERHTISGSTPSDNNYVHIDVKVRDHWHVTGKYRSFPHRDCNINVKLNLIIPIVIRNLNNIYSNLIMVELGKFNLKINVIPNELEKYITFNINNNLVFIDSFQFLCSLSDSLVKNLGENDLKYLIQESDNNILDLVKQKGFYNEYISDLKKNSLFLDR